jgi:hypothetical protein
MYINPNVHHLCFWKCFSCHIVIELWFRSLPLYAKYRNMDLYTGWVCILSILLVWIVGEVSLHSFPTDFKTKSNETFGGKK